MLVFLGVVYVASRSSNAFQAASQSAGSFDVHAGTVDLLSELSKCGECGLLEELLQRLVR